MMGGGGWGRRRSFSEQCRVSCASWGVPHRYRIEIPRFASDGYSPADEHAIQLHHEFLHS